MKNKWLVALFLGYSIMVLGGCVPKQPENINSKGTAIICFGDSLTFGYGVEIGQDYPTLLSRILNRSVINAGVDGDTSTDALRRLESDVLKQNPLLVIVEFGGNDFLKGVPRQDTEKNISYMIERIHARGAMVALVDISAGMLLSEYRELLWRIAKENNVIFIPQALRGIITDSRLKSDFLHPNAAGYSLIAQRIYRAIIPFLNRNRLIKSGLSR